MIPLQAKKKVRKHFDLASPFYQKLWGVHIHHRFYISGKESKEKAQGAFCQVLKSFLGNEKRRYSSGAFRYGFIVAEKR